ncbi:MAG: efflux RND transporter periplasmic adaptor subunit [Planctomycetes bacterium]|nr:efflux RND transporter periplasmic adaptor subunit [Planctomycetota bacterium]
MNSRSFGIAGSILGLVSVAVAAVVALPRLWPGKPDADPQSQAASKSATTVVLTEAKAASLKIRCEPAVEREIEESRIVPGKLEYRRVRRVELKAPVDAVVQEVKVKPGAEVAAGTPLAILTSPGVGLARAEVERSESDLRIANRTQEWNDAITRNLSELQTFLREKPTFEEVELKFNNKLLGDHRKNVLPAYSRFVLATKVWETQKKAVRDGSTTEQSARRAETERDVAWESFLAESEQAEYEAWQAREKALQARVLARRNVDVSRKKLETLLGEYSKPDDGGDDAAHEGTELTRFFLAAPFAGTVEQRLTSDTQRVEAGTLLFVFANTDVLEVSAMIRDRDWPTVAAYLRDGLGKPLKVSVPILGDDREFEATIDYVGRFVDDVNMAVPLVALVDNAHHELLPGMFARIRIPAGQVTRELVIPPAALRTNDGQDFVFVADEREARTYHRLDVTVGKRTGEWVTIASGLAAGQKVVVEGAFALKNELLLEPDEE